MENLQKIKPVYTLRHLTGYFLRLGYSGFGGPVALVGYMHRDLVEKKQWFSEEDYKEGLALAQLAPGPLAAQLAIYLGFVHYRVIGATIAGVAFILPSFLMVLVLGIIYHSYGGLPWIQAVFYGVGAAVIAIISLSAYKLTVKSVTRLAPAAIRKNWMLWSLFSWSLAATVVTRSEQLVLFITAGLIYALYRSPNFQTKFFSQQLPVLILGQVAGGPLDMNLLGRIAAFFLKAGAFVFGSGLAIVPFLQEGLVSGNHWLTETEFLDAVAIAMITPGPVVITVGFIGYLIAGFPGACVASFATFLPCYLFTIIPAPYFSSIAKMKSVKDFVDGITAAVIGALVGSVIIISHGSLKDVPTILIALVTLCVLIFFKKVKEPLIILAAAVAGLILKL